MFYFEFSIIIEVCITTLVFSYPIGASNYFYYVYQYFFVKQDIEQVFPGKTLELLIDININDLSHNHINYTDYLSDKGICALCAGLEICYYSYEILTINNVVIPYYYDVHSKIVNMIYKKAKANRKNKNIRIQQEIINNLKN
jgi:hypothetical protein